jgi:hypothetical protein
MQTPDRGQRLSPNRLEISGEDKRSNPCFPNEYQFRILSGTINKPGFWHYCIIYIKVYMQLNKVKH